MKLYTYFRSSAAYRVRIALNLKNIDCELVPINLLKAENIAAPYLKINPQGLVPALELDTGEIITQSPAIIEWLEETFTDHPLLPSNPSERAEARAMCSTISSDIHPIDNLRVLKYLANELNVNDVEKTQWYHHWITLGFDVLENKIKLPFSYGKNPSIVDAYLIPQVYNALRFKLDMSRYPKISAAYGNCNQLEAFIKAQPEHQPDAA